MDFDETSTSTNFTSNYPNQDGVNEFDDLLFLDKDFQQQQFYPSKDCILFLIDCSPSMFNIVQNFDNSKTTPLSSILNITENFLKTKIISNQNDLFGIILFNTSKTNNEMNFEGVNVLFKIEAPNAFNIKKIKMLSEKCDPEINNEKYKSELNELFSPIENNPQKINFLNNALWIAQSLLKKMTL